MRTLLKILISGLLLVLAVAVGAEVVALRRLSSLADATAGTSAPTVVVRKAAHVPAPTKSVRSLPVGKRGARRHSGS
ncbi:hypothetical protein [Hymenobacter ruricola]|uniref:Uncharacterized protein n=1 Tax=Hymenobacter ruricola TaxID=2791023 RepID=A0ABS0I0R7_9BACT|nr:hypothetical protein [Hymenobacter ruricola]MBF9220531.1 hypothetical protein [Hymenobacter ruricola]